jgi:hypothetical protein
VAASGHRYLGTEVWVQQADIDRFKAEIKEHGDVCVRAKWTMDGATTLLEAATKLRNEAEWLEDLASAGFELNGPIEDDYGFIGHPEVIPDDPEEDEET